MGKPGQIGTRIIIGFNLYHGALCQQRDTSFSLHKSCNQSRGAKFAINVVFDIRAGLCHLHVLVIL